jgi:hypothetical protein
MVSKRREAARRILSDPDARRRLMIKTIQATQAREGIETSEAQAEKAYYIVTEADLAVFFALAKYRSSESGDKREEAFIEAISGDVSETRFDIPRRDFASIESAPLAFDRMSILAPLFRENPSLMPAYGETKQGLTTVNDERFLRYHWEIPLSKIGQDNDWARVAKGGDFSRFYYDYNRLVLWRDNGKELKDFILEREGTITKRIYSQAYYFRQAVCWPRRTQRGFNVRYLPEGYIFTDKNPCVFLKDGSNLKWFLALLNTSLVEYILRGLTSFGSFEEGAVRKLPIAAPSTSLAEKLEGLAVSIYEAKLSWNKGNELCSCFTEPWILREDIADPASSVTERLDYLAEYEARQTESIQRQYAELNDHAYRLYGINDRTRATIEETLGERPPEIIWPQMEKRDAEQKRMEHVCRLLSYLVKRVVAAD